MWLLALLILPALLWLGFWQLDRAAEKQERQARWQQLAPRDWPIPGNATEGQPVRLTGHYRPDRQWLLDNRTRDGRVGYEVLALFQPDQGAPVVVNRGWVPGYADREQLPDVELGEAPVQIRARVADWPAPPIVGSVEHPREWPRRVQFLTHELAASDLARPPAPLFLRLADSGQAGALQADWEPSWMGASTHYGYAVQWFGLALALIVMTVVASFRSIRSTEPHP